MKPTFTSIVFAAAGLLLFSSCGDNATTADDEGTDSFERSMQDNEDNNNVTKSAYDENADTSTMNNDTVSY